MKCGSVKQGLGTHCRRKKVATGLTVDDQEIIVDTKPKQALLGPGNQASRRFGLTV